MKHTSRALMYITLILGGLGALLFLWLSGTQDDRGLLPAAHISQTLLLILTGLFFLFLIVSVGKMPAQGDYLRYCPGNFLTAAGSFLAAVGILCFSVINALYCWNRMMILALPAGFLAAGAMLISAFSRARKQKPPLACLVLICVYAMIHAISQSHHWRAEPQVIRYFYPLMASILLMLSAYHHAAFSQQPKGLRSFLITGQAALFFSLISLHDQAGLYYLAMSLWLISGSLSSWEEPA